MIGGGKHTKSSHVVTVADRQETNKGDLHTSKRAQRVPGGVADVETRAVSSHAQQDKDVEREQVGDEDVTTPGRDHVTVEKSSKGTPHDGTLLDTLDPQVEGEDEEEDGNGFVIVTASHGTRDVTGGNAHEDGGKEASRGRVGHLRGQEVTGKGSQARACGSQHDADVADVDREGEKAEEVVDGAAGDHETRVESTTGDTAKRVPCAVVEPVPEAREAIRHEVLCCAEVEPGVDYGRGLLVTIKAV